MKLQDQLHEILIDLFLAGTESALMLGAIVLLLVGLVSNKSWILKSVFTSTIVIAIYLNLQITDTGFFLSQGLYTTAEIGSFTSIFLLYGIFILLFPRTKHATEFYFLILALLVGSIFMMKVNNLLLIYLAIELVSFVSYILTGFSFKKEGFEASIKYLLFGALSTAIMLTGLGLVYGTTGGFYLADWSQQGFDSLISQVGLLFVVFGILFKTSILPFHIWTPATYQFAPVDLVAILSIVPKIAGFILLKRVLIHSGLAYDHPIMNTLLILGMCTIIIGTLGALRQIDARRMISFGSIAQSGFLLGLLLTPVYNQDAFWWYAAVYGIMNYGAFFLIGQFESLSVFSIKDYSRSKKETLIGVSLSLILISLVGLPPLGGFTAKLFLFSTLWEGYQATGFAMLVLYLGVSVLATIASLFFYLKIPKNIFLSEEISRVSEGAIVFSSRSKIIATIFAITLLMLFFVPKLVMSLQPLLNNVHE